jgi:heptosyltransferase-3
MIKYLKTYLTILLRDHAFRNSLIKNILFFIAQTFRHRTGKNKKRIILINLTEHMGDIVATEPVARHLRQKNPGAYIVWCVNEKFADLVRHNPALDAIITVTCIAEWILLKKMIRKIIIVFDLHLNGRSCSTYKLTNKNPNTKRITVFNYLRFGNLLDVFSKTAGIESVENTTPVFHFSGDKNDEVVFPFDYIVVHPLANDQERNWSNEQWNALVIRILDQYPTLHVAEIGLQSVVSNSSPRFHNLTSKYNLQQIAHIIKRARLFIGVESGFGHFANALGTNSIVMFGYYQQYKNYQVYSGRFAEGKDVTLYYHQGKLRHLKMEDVWPSVEMRLNLDKHGEKLMRV